MAPRNSSTTAARLPSGGVGASGQSVRQSPSRATGRGRLSSRTARSEDARLDKETGLPPRSSSPVSRSSEQLPNRMRTSRPGLVASDQRQVEAETDGEKRQSENRQVGREGTQRVRLQEPQEEADGEKSDDRRGEET